MPPSRDLVALDASPANRSFDVDGHLHVRDSAISIAAVNGYRGEEIPNFEGLGLQPDRIYQLLRHPDELAGAVDTFQGKPLMIVHKPQVASDHDRSVVVGAVRDPRWVAPFMRATLDVWDGQAIGGIERETQHELSSAYRYEAVMTPGEYEGVAYDGVMTNIACNHVTLVEKGRAGSHVVVGDSAIPTPEEKAAMANKVAALSRSALFASGALRVYLKPKLATDAKLDVLPMFAGITAKTWKADKAKIKLALDKALPKGSPLLAKDADIADVVDMLDQLDEMVDQVDDATVTPAVDPAVVVDADPDAETEDEKKERLAKRAAAKAKADADATGGTISKPAMDAAIATAVAKVAADTELATVTRMRAIQEAERTVRPWIGELAIAQDSADKVYKFALDTLGVETKDVHPSAYRAVLIVQPKPGDPTPRTRVALDSVSEEASFRAKYPTASKLVRA